MNPKERKRRKKYYITGTVCILLGGSSVIFQSWLLVIATIGSVYMGSRYLYYNA